MRWLLLKDLQILRRSPLQAALLVAYPILVALLIGFAISRDGDEPRVAFLNEIPADARITAGETELPAVGIDERICQQIECVRVDDRAAAEEMVRSGETMAALILPADLIERLNSLASLDPKTPLIEVVVNNANPLEGQVVDDRIEAMMARANLVIARQIGAEGGRFLNLVVDGGEVEVEGQAVQILGLRATASILEALRPAVPEQMRAPLDRVIRFATMSRDNLDIATPLIDRISQPIAVQKDSISADTPTLDTFAIAAAATLTLTFVTLLLVAGSLALEREENTYSRLVGGLVSRTALIAEKVGLGVAVGLLVTLLMLAGVQLFVGLEWGRFGLWLLAIVAGGAALGAAGAALGAAARDVRAVSLLAFMISLPVALLSLVPAGAVGGVLDDVIQLVAALFPFEPTLEAISAALDPDGGGLGEPLLHLAILIVAYASLARLALRRFGSL